MVRPCQNSDFGAGKCFGFFMEEVFGLCFDWGLCLGYFGGSLWTKRGILWKNKIWDFRVLD